MRSRGSSLRRLALALFAVTLSACAGGGGAGSSGGATRGSSTSIAPDELATVAEMDLFAAISRLRPTWIRTSGRGGPPGVVMDGSQQAGGVDALRSIRVADIAEVRYMNASDATTRYGTGYTGGAIVITTRR